MSIKIKWEDDFFKSTKLSENGLLLKSKTFPAGTIREYNGIKHQKQSDGSWKPVKKENGFTYDQWKKEKEKIEKETKDISEKIKEIGGGQSVDVPEETRNKPEYKKLTEDFKQAFKKERDFNSNKEYKKFQKQFHSERRASWKNK
jgi:hypothetical protein